MIKKILVLVISILSLQTQAAVESVECKITSLNILNDTMISDGYSLVTLSKATSSNQVFFDIKAVNDKNVTVDSVQYFEDINLDSASRIQIPSWQYFKMSFVKIDGQFKLEMTDDQDSSDVRYFENVCKVVIK